MSYVEEQYQRAVEQRRELRRHDPRQARREKLEAILALATDAEFQAAVANLSNAELHAMTDELDEVLRAPYE